MSGIFLCKTHGLQAPMRTSPRLEAELRLKEPIPANWVSLVVVKSGTRTSWYLVDSEILGAAGLDPTLSPFFLEDRDRALRALNDRLLIMKLFPAEAKNSIV